jgi:alpha-tubulin suppressor-like RCC1 family protein
MGAGESHAFAATTAGAVYGWGANQYGQVGNGATDDLIDSPAVISGVAGTVRDFAASVRHTLALTEDGAVWGWGDNCTGQLGDGSAIDRLTPVRVQFPPGTVVTAIDAASDTDAPCAAFSMALDNAGNVWVWGTNAHWQLAQHNTTSGGGPDELCVPTRVAGLSNATAIGAGWRFAVAVSGGQVYAWGDGGQGALGDNACGVDHFAAAPGLVSGLSDVKRVSSARFGYQFTLALKGDGTVWGWGDNSGGQLGDGSTGVDNACPGIATPMRGRMTPVQATGLTNVVDVRAGAYHSLVLKNDGTVWAWGDNTDGLLGKDVSSATTVLTPTQMPGL